MDKSTHTRADTKDATPAEQGVDELVLLRIGAYTAGAVAAVRAGVTKIWDVFYDNFKSYPLIEAERDARKVKRQELCDVAKEQKLSRKEFLQRYHKIENDYGHNFNTLIKDNFGIESEGFVGAIKGTWHRFQALGEYTQAKIAFGMVGSTALAVGSVVVIEKMLAKNAQFKKLHDALEAKQAEENQQAR